MTAEQKKEQKIRLLRACLVSNRVRLGGAKSALLQREQPHVSWFCAAASYVFEAFLSKRAIRQVLRVHQNLQKGLTLTFTKQALKAKVAVVLQDELGRAPKTEEIEQVTLLARVMYKAVLGLHKRKEQKKNGQLAIF